MESGEAENDQSGKTELLIKLKTGNPCFTKEHHETGPILVNILPELINPVAEKI